MQISNNRKEIRSAKEKKTANNNIRPVKQQHTHLLQNNRKVEKNEWKSFLYCVFTFRLFDLGPSRKVMSKQTKITTKTVREKDHVSHIGKKRSANGTECRKKGLNNKRKTIQIRWRKQQQAKLATLYYFPRLPSKAEKILSPIE